MSRLSKAIVVLAALVSAALAFGFVLFATTVMRDPVGDWSKADGIVVLTGGDNRIVAGAKLLSEGRANRLLISGVNRKTKREDIERISGLSHKLAVCCVDLGYEALDTVGNADETRTWANTNGYKRILVVTSSYHMPRGLAELALAMPGVELLPHAVMSRNFPYGGWWLHVETTRILLSEYLKFLPAAARLQTQRMLGWRDDPSVVIAMPQAGNG